MIPVSLKLRNFLSYGTAAEALDFEQFHVACLSGGNGQGKSALLDAITWAIWGEARKAAGTQKPDDELLRIGTRDMEVELVFELERHRYRVVRGYQRSASGKTNKSTLEFQVWDGDGATFRPLTGGSLRETQETINTTLGLDYDTFINSAFLLQGRSDEFTKKKPGERKEILARILGLDRYDRLASAARDKWSAANERTKEAEREIERLTAALEDEGRWQAELAAVEAVIATKKAEKEKAQQAEAACTERLAELDALAQQTSQQEARLQRLAARKTELETERAELRGRIEQAETLIAQAEAIRRDHQRYEDLLDQRRALDDKADLKRGLETQLHEKKLALERQRMEAEGRLTRLDAQLRTDRDGRADAERRLAERPRVARALEQARAAQREYEQLRRQYEARQRIEARLVAIDKQLAGERGALQATISQLRIRIREAEEHAERLPALVEQAAGLKERVEAVRRLEAEQTEVRETGSGIRAEIEALQRDVERLQQEDAALAEKAQRIEGLETETCPTCGTPLTEAHRREVARTYAQERAALAHRVEEVRQRLQARQQDRERLLQRFQELKARLGRINGVADEYARVQSQIEQLQSAAATLEEQRQRAQDLQRQLEEEAYLPELRVERAELEDRLEAEPFDPERYEIVQQEAAHRGRYEEQLRELDEVQGRFDELAQRIERQEREAKQLREDLAAGAPFGPLSDQIRHLQQQLETVGYDGARHEAVRRELDALKQAPERFMQLANAERNLTDWSARRDRLGAELEELGAEVGQLTAAVVAAAERLQEREDLQTRQRELARQRADIEAALSQAQARLGGLKERLERCARDREALAEVRRQHKEAKREKTLYRHLRDAFGKNGIPALIIEETLPEVEDRANALLERLSGGRTHVHLETLKDKKAGGTKETLDIRITDEAGTSRPYETFSGGEAFRVNFALRIALAQLLAERSGVRIRTLVVDEGFGTQDKQGIESLVEAIQTIREDFDKVLVITHLDELKEAFPVRIEVEKHPVVGSRFDVLGV